MSREYERIIDWFLTMLGDEKVRQPILEWLGPAHDQAATSSCGCSYCEASHRVLHYFKDMKRSELIDGSPWIRVAAMGQIGSFLDTLPKTPQTLEAVAACKAEFARIITDSGDEIEVTADSDVSGNDQTTEMMTMATTKILHLDNPVGTHVVGVTFFNKEGNRVEAAPGLTYRDMAQQYIKQAEEEEQTVAVSERIDAFVLEGAYAFQSALKEKFGWVGLRPIPPKSFFDMGEQPKTIDVQVGPNDTVPVIWGRVVIPGITGYLETGFEYKEGRFYFSVTGEVQQKFMPQVRELMDLTKKHITLHSIYKGQALRLDLPLPTDRTRFSPQNAPVFMDLSTVNPDELIFSQDVDRAIRTNLFHPIEKTELCRRLGIGLKRGALLAGEPGTGKTQTAANIAKKCVENGWTCFYVKQVSDIATMYRLAASYAPAVLIAEDIDRIGLGEERTAELNELINTLDGIDTKGAEVMVVFTTNKKAKEMNSALKRTGRLDFIINMMPPDKEAAKRLIRLYSRGRLVDGISLDRVSEMLAGQIPATIKEVCSRAMLSAVGHMENDDDLQVITDEDLETAAFTMLAQIELATADEQVAEPDSDEERAAEFLGKRVERGLEKFGTALAGTLEGIVNRTPALEAQKGTNGTNGHSAKPGAHHETPAQPA